MKGTFDMTLVFALGGSLRKFSLALVAASIFGSLTGTVWATDPHYVLPDGSRVALSKSETELGVVFRAGGVTDDAIVRIERMSQGSVGDIQGAEETDFKLLRIEAVTQSLVETVRGDVSVQDVGAVYRLAGETTPVISSGTIVVRLRPGMTVEEQQQVWDAYGLVDALPMDQMDGVFRVRPVDGTIDEVLLAEQMADDGRTVWANPNFRRLTEVRQLGPSDPFFAQQWHLRNTGESGGIEGADINVVGAWAVADGEGVLIGMLDDSCDVDHEDLAGNYIGVGQNVATFPGAEDAGDPRPQWFDEAHGTAVMGLMVASANNIGVRGVAPGARFTASRGVGSFRTEFEAASAYTFALAQGVDVHNNSWGYHGNFPNPPIVVDAIEKAFTRGRDLDGPGGDPPLGMVILFASGNDGKENRVGFELSTLDSVIGVGGTNDRDSIVSYSNYGREIDVMAPTWDLFMGGIVTTDVEDDRPNSVGYNFAGYNWAFDTNDIDPTGKYSGLFNGTSASCPIASGVAALILSANPQLPATDVRLILEHTAERVSPLDARYNGITARSLTYGYGRINAEKAVLAARDSLSTENRAWPDRPKDVSVVSSTLLWRASHGADDFLVIEGSRDYSFVPDDGVCYDARQLGCESASIASLPADLRVLYVGCGNECADRSRQSAVFSTAPGARKFFALYSHNQYGKYSFGVGIDSVGNEAGGSRVLGAPDQQGPTTRVPAVNIIASPLRGQSPLTVRFNGNAVSELDLDRSRLSWDFDTNDDVFLDSATAAAVHTYTAPLGESRTYTARLTMYDVAGNPGLAEVQILVIGAEPPSGATLNATPGLRITVGIPGSLGSDLASGKSPFEAELGIASDTLGTTVQSVQWDLGDGDRSGSLNVLHTYINTSDETRNFVAVATVNLLTGSGAVVSETVSRVITVAPGSATGQTVDATLPGTTPFGEGGAATPCGALGLIPMLFSLASLMWLRRRS